MKKAGGASPSPTKMPLPNGEVPPKVTERGELFDKHALSPATLELSRRESLLK